MKKYRNIIIIVLLGILVLLFFNERRKNNRLSINNTLLELELNKLDNNLQIFKDENDFNRARADVAEGDLRHIRIVYENELKELRNEFSQLNRRYNNLSSIYRTSLSTIKELELNIDSLLTEIDTTFTNEGEIENVRFTRGFYYNDEWSNITGTYVLNTIFSMNDQVNLNYHVRDSLTFITYFQRDNIFSKRNLFIEGISHNPNTSITNLSNVRVNNYKDHNWSVGLQSGYGITQHGLGWYIGLGINRKLFSW